MTKCSFPAQRRRALTRRRRLQNEGKQSEAPPSHSALRAEMESRSSGALTWRERVCQVKLEFVFQNAIRSSNAWEGEESGEAKLPNSKCHKDLSVEGDSVV